MQARALFIELVGLIRSRAKGRGLWAAGVCEVQGSCVVPPFSGLWGWLGLGNMSNADSVIRGTSSKPLCVRVRYKAKRSGGLRGCFYCAFRARALSIQLAAPCSLPLTFAPSGGSFPCSLRFFKSKL